MDNFDEGLRCQDVHSGLRNLDPSSPLLAPLNETRLVGMAATTAGLIRGRDVVTDADALMQVAAHQLDVPPMSFNEIVRILEDAGFIEGVQRSGRKVDSFTENVPYYDDLYSRLGDVWREGQPTETEQQLLVIVDGLARAPLPLDDLENRFGLDSAAVPSLIDVGTRSGLVRTLRTVDGDLAYSPFFGFENPAGLTELVNNHGSDQLMSEFALVRARQGLEINSSQHPLLTSAVAGGLVMAPTVQLPNGTMQAFAAMPYVSDKTLLSARKPVLEKALAVLACLRCAENHGEYNTLSADGLVNVIDKLLDPNRGFLAPNSAHRRQYELIRNAGLIRFAPDTLPGGKWVTPTFIDTEDNRAALLLARDLIVHGEMVEQRVDDSVARQALDLGKNFRAPMQTAHRMRRESAELAPQHWERVIEKAMSWGAL